MSTYSGASTRRALSAPALAGIALIAAFVIVFAGNYHVQSGENGGTGPAIITGAICLALAVGLFGFVVPRATNLDRTAFILAVIGVISVVVFWSGVTPVLAAASLAVTSRGETPPSRKVQIAEALAVLASLAALIVTLGQSHLF